MPDFLASYDLRDTKPSPYGPFLTHAKTLGWRDTSKMISGPDRELPNTTLIGSFPTLEAAAESIEQAKAKTASELKTAVTLTRYVVAEIGAMVVINNNTALGGLLGVGARR